MKNKFTIEKNYNISIIAEGLDVNKADVEFCLLLEDFKLSLPLKNIKENVFRLKLPSKIKDTIKEMKSIEYCINVRNDNLIFEVARSKFELELFAIKEVTIAEADEENEEDVLIENVSVVIEEQSVTKPLQENNKSRAAKLIAELSARKK